MLNLRGSRLSFSLSHFGLLKRELESSRKAHSEIKVSRYHVSDSQFSKAVFCIIDPSKMAHIQVPSHRCKGSARKIIAAQSLEQTWGFALRFENGILTESGQSATWNLIQEI